MSAGSFFTELRKRKVVQTAAYLVENGIAHGIMFAVK